MTAVYNKIVRTKSTVKQVDEQVRQYPGINFLTLGQSGGLGEITIEFICSDAEPTQPRTIKDIDNVLMHLDITKVLDSHRNDPITAGKSNHLLQISTNTKEDNEETEEIERG